MTITSTMQTWMYTSPTGFSLDFPFASFLLLSSYSLQCSIRAYEPEQQSHYPSLPIVVISLSILFPFLRLPWIPTFKLLSCPLSLPLPNLFSVIIPVNNMADLQGILSNFCPSCNVPKFNGCDFAKRTKTTHLLSERYRWMGGC